MNKSLLLLPLMLAWASAEAQQPQRPASPVETSKAEMRKIAPTVTAAGQVQSRSGADMAAGAAGQLEFVAEPGARVGKGDLIARVDVAELRLQRAEQAARLTRGQVALKQAGRELERLRASGNAVSRFQLDQAENTRDLAAADIGIAQAALRQTDERISRAEVRAPFAGVVAERLKREGEEVTRGELVARLQDTDHLEIRLFLPLRHVRAIQAGSTVQVRMADDSTALARVRAIVPVGDARTQSFETLIDAPALSPPLAVGNSVRVELPLESPKLALAVPRDALVIRTDGMSVYRVKLDADQKRTVERVPVKTTIAEGSWVAVEGALAADDAVVVRGAESLHHGDAVQIVQGHTT
ncbi:MAG TPA: efflux RND transporter periplasmic adaptor subunit [Solimonas sp.]|nr:efflux RND transporter periplasmic adaptor subunit [Solimonas sp.]